ncbi:MAG: ABC transporter ATP-binding protein [Chloroflexi bacterium]|nr:ABC transporter ATP-binding protein [Chloroflexota bacterium]
MNTPTPPTNFSLSTHNLAIGYTPSRRPATVVADQINVALRPGELVALIGPNGAGKSTLMRTLAGMQAPLRGQVCLGKDDLHRLPADVLAKRLAVVLTERIDVGNLSAYALAALGRHPYTDWRGKLTPHDEEVVQWAMTAVGATALAHRSVNELSDGERQKVMIARALAQEPQVLILDEPTAFLDLPRRVELMRLLGTLAYTTQRAILLSTHDLDLALRVADRLWLLPSGGPLMDGIPEELAFNGALAETFQSEGVEFDSMAGTFKLHRQPCGPIGLEGEGLLGQWTARALERIGFEVVRNGGDLEIPVPVTVEVGAAQWRVKGQVGPHEFTTLADLLTYLRQPRA